jgi:hypothetical protein
MTKRNRVNYIRHTTIVGAFVFLLSCVSKNDDEIGKPEVYTLTERKMSEDCNAYLMGFWKGGYILRFALAGSCKCLTREEYIQEYSRSLNCYWDSLANRRGYIIFDYYFANSDALQDSIINITRRKFKAFVFLSEVDKNSFTIKVSDSIPKTGAAR